MIDFPYEKKKIVILIALIILVLFKGLRWDTGTDWEQFYRCFENADWNNIFTYQRYDSLDEKMEPGYMFLNVFIKMFGNYTLFLLCQCFFVCATWAFLSFRLVPQRPIMAFAMVMVFNHFFPIRLPLAGAIVCWVFYFALKRKYILSVIICFIAYSIHKSAFFAFPFIFIINREFPKIFVWIVFVLSMLGEILADYISLAVLGVALYLPENLQENVIGYSDAVISGYTEKSRLSLVMGVFLSFFFFFLFLKVRDMIKEYAKKDKIGFHKKNFNVFLVYLNCYVFFSFFHKFFTSPMLTNFTRVAEYFTLGCAICMVVSHDYLKRYVSEGVLYSFFCIYYFYKLFGLLNTPYPDAFYPYKSVLW